MPFERPTLTALRQRAEADLGVEAGLRRSVERVLARVLAGMAHGLHGHLDWVYRQAFPDTADPEYLERWATLFGVPPKPATRASAQVRWDYVEPAEIPVGTRAKRADGKLYRVTETEEREGVEGTIVTVRALEAGSEASLTDGTVLTLISPIAGVPSTGLAWGDGVPGTDRESPESLLARLMRRLEQPERAGGPGDHVFWALEVPGVTRAWEFPLYLGPGTLAVFVAADDAEGGPIPSQDLVDDVRDHLDEKRPPTENLHVFAPVPDPVDIEAKIKPDTFLIRAALEGEWRKAIREHSSPGGRTLRSRLLDAFSLARELGLEDYELVEPAETVQHQPGHLAVPGDFTFSNF